MTAIDPRAPEGPIIRRVGIEEFTDPGPFDHVVANLSLHHIENLGGTLPKTPGNLNPERKLGGFLAYRT